ncbi:hypothetical protein GCM10020000_46700 [Streptomyces olivoverticillatus]
MIAAYGGMRLPPMNGSQSGGRLRPTVAPARPTHASPTTAAGSTQRMDQHTWATVDRLVTWLDENNRMSDE